MNEAKLYVQYGSGPFSAPPGWKNFDASPTLKLQQLPLVGKLLKRKMPVVFHPDAIQGDILKGLPGIREGSCDGIYCCHVLEHLSYRDCLLAIRNTCKLLKPGAYFRCVVPDLEVAARRYLDNLHRQDHQANVKFMEETLLGKESRPRGITKLLKTAFGNMDHLYMWDYPSLTQALLNAGFSHIRKCSYHDSRDEMFRQVEEEERFNNAVALEATK